MNTIIKLAFKNLTRQKRRNAILAIAIAFGFFVVTFLDGLTTGMVGNLENTITQIAGGTVILAGYEKIPPVTEGGKYQLVNIVRDREYVQDLVKNSNINYKSFSCYTLSPGQIIFGGRKSVVAVYGRDLKEKAFLDSLQLKAGNVEELSRPDAMIINEKVAENMNLEIGDSVIFTTTTIYGQNTVADYTIVAISKGNSFIDATRTFVNIDSLNELVGIPKGGYSTFTIQLKNEKEQTKVANKLEQLIREDGYNVSSRAEAFKTNPGNIGKGIDKQFAGKDVIWDGVKYGVETLDDEIPQLKTVMNIVHMVTTIILIVILLIVMVGVSNTYRMVLYERIREIGTMRALGMTGKNTGHVFTTEAVVLCLIGALSGLVLAVIGMTIVHFIPVTNESLSFFLHKGHFSFTVSIGTVILQYLLLIILTTIAVRGSAKKAAALSPAEALRSIK